jgi:hypothetical protein
MLPCLLRIQKSILKGPYFQGFLQVAFKFPIFCLAESHAIANEC